MAVAARASRSGREAGQPKVVGSPDTPRYAAVKHENDYRSYSGLPDADAADRHGANSSGAAQTPFSLPGGPQRKTSDLFRMRMILITENYRIFPCAGSNLFALAGGEIHCATGEVPGQGAQGRAGLG